jgi:uncharacterized small protein (DUF1192 family)
MTDLTKILNNPEEHYPGNFDTPQRANALLTGLCQDAANEIAKLQAELTRLKASIALDKMAENARELGLDYEPAVQERNFCERCGKRLGGDGHIHTCTPPAAQPAVQEGRDWSLLEATQESLREHMAEIKRLKAAQPVKTYSGGKPWPVAPAPDPAPIIQQLVTALEGSGTRMRSDQWYIEIEAVAAGKFYLNSKGEGL